MVNDLQVKFKLTTTLTFRPQLAPKFTKSPLTVGFLTVLPQTFSATEADSIVSNVTKFTISKVIMLSEPSLQRKATTYQITFHGKPQVNGF